MSDFITTKYLNFIFSLAFFKIHKWVKPSVTQRGAGQGGPAIHIHKAELTRILSNAGTPYTSANISTVCAGINGASADFRSDFGKSHRELSVKIPREAVNEDHLKNIDSCECMLFIITTQPS